MSTERTEGQPKRTLFPLCEEAVMTASCALRDVVNTGDVQLVAAHLREIVARPIVPPTIRDFFRKRYGEIPDDPGIKNYYVYGTAISIDSVSFQSALQEKEVIPVLNKDLNAYIALRKRLVGPRWFEASDEILKLMERNLTQLLKNADPAYHSAFNEIDEADRTRSELERDIAFLLGLCDFYFPFRYADERVRIMRDAD